MDRAELARRLNFSLLIPGRLAGLGWPFLRLAPEEEVATLLREAGVRVLLNLTEHSYPAGGLEGFERLHLPVVDYEPPSLGQLDAVWARFQALAPGEVLALHCAAGIGRTGTALACLLGRASGLSPREAIAEVRRRRPGSIETLAQERRIAQWLAGDAV
jgi:atypical dual specificity phosphatase